MGGGGGGSGGGNTVQTVRFAPYVESAHRTLLGNIVTERMNAIDESPYEDFDELDYSVGFFGTGYTLSSFPSLWDMYGKFMAGLDIDVMYDEIFDDLINGPEVGAAISAEADRLTDQLEEEILPRFETGLRDMNSVISSSFVVGRGMIESARVKAISRFSAELRYKLLPAVADRWRTHLDWNKGVISQYAEILKFWILVDMDARKWNFQTDEADKMWPFMILREESAAISTMTGAKNIKQTGGPEGPSQTAKALGGAMSGAAAGYMVGGPWGAVIGGFIGLGSAFM